MSSKSMLIHVCILPCLVDFELLLPSTSYLSSDLLPHIKYVSVMVQNLDLIRKIGQNWRERNMFLQ